jgi:hypothetical protein
MSTGNESSDKSESMAEKIYAIMRGERQPDDWDIPDYYEEIQTIRKLPVSHFLDLKQDGWKAKTIAQRYGLSEFKVRKILKDPNTSNTYVTYEYEDIPLRASRVRYAKKIVDSNGLEVDAADIIDLAR